MKKLLAVISACIFTAFAFPQKQTYAAGTDMNTDMTEESDMGMTM